MENYFIATKIVSFLHKLQKNILCKTSRASIDCLKVHSNIFFEIFIYFEIVFPVVGVSAPTSQNGYQHQVGLIVSTNVCVLQKKE
jgi:hypothetical protein